MTGRLGPAVAAVAALVPALALAHHGVATVGLGGPEGPGAAIETTSPLTLPEGTLFLLGKAELVPFRQRAVPQQGDKRLSSFNLLAIGYGLTPWLSAFAFQPYNLKEQVGLGRNAGAGDTNLMLALGFKWDEGLRLLPQKESLDELMDWHFSAWGASTVPVGPTTRRDRLGRPFEPDMQTGFGAPSVTAGLAAMKQLSADLTWLADVSTQHFVAHTYPFTRYQFGGETRLDVALAWRAVHALAHRLDLVVEANGLSLERDREAPAPGQALAPVRASGGTILYGTLGLRYAHGAFSLGLGLKRAMAKRLHEQADQQGSEGLEDLRAALTLGWSTRL